jgi:ribosomal protein S18 acetylase RimI-like enzyme
MRRTTAQVPVELRAATAADEDTHRAAFAAARAELLGALDLPGRLTEELLLLQYRAMSQQYRQAWPGADCSTVLIDGKAAGRLVVDRGPSVLRVVDIALLPEFQGLGFGSRLLERVLREAAAEGRVVTLQVAGDNLGARRLYDRLGFRQRGESGGVYVEMEWVEPRAQPGAAGSDACTIRTSRGVQAS